MNETLRAVAQGVRQCSGIAAQGCGAVREQSTPVKSPGDVVFVTGALRWVAARNVTKPSL